MNSLEHLQSITTLHLPMPFFFPEDEERHDGLVEDEVIMRSCHLVDVGAVLEYFPPTIHSLRILTFQTPQTPIRFYDSLTELEIFATEFERTELVGLDLVFRHLTALQSLSLVGYFASNLFSLFPLNSSQSLSRLTSFRLSVESFDNWVEDECVWTLCEFLKNRPLLRSLYIRHPDLEWNQVSQLLPIVRELAGLEVLGLHTGEHWVQEEEIGLLVQSLSPNLKALHLAFDWGGANILPLVSFFPFFFLNRISLNLASAVGRRDRCSAPFNFPSFVWYFRPFAHTA